MPGPGPTLDEIQRRELATAEHARALAEAAWPARFAEEVSAFSKDQQRINGEIIRQVNEHMDELRVAHNALAHQVRDLRKELGTERTARKALEAQPRQTINVTVPERETVVNIDVPPAEVNVALPRRTTDVERDDKGRIVRTTQRDV